MSAERVACDASALVATDAALPGLRTVCLAPWGETETKHGKILIDREAVSAIVAEFQGHGVEKPIDLEHESIDESLPAERRGALGWITKVWGEAGRGLFALVRWSERARELIRLQTFQYLSPTLIVRKSDRRAVALDSAALTTRPAIPAMEKLAASATLLAPDGKENSMSEATTELLAAACGRLGLPKESEPSAVVAALNARLDAADELLAMRSQLEAAAFAAKTARVEALIASATKQNKLSSRDPVAMAAARKLAESDPDAFEAIYRGIPNPLPRLRFDDEPPMGSRDSVIRAALHNFDATPQLAKLTSRKAFCSQKLRDAGLEPLAPAEIERLSI